MSQFERQQVERTRRWQFVVHGRDRRCGRQRLGRQRLRRFNPPSGGPAVVPSCRSSSPLHGPGAGILPARFSGGVLPHVSCRLVTRSAACALLAHLLCASIAAAQVATQYRPVLLGTRGVRSYAYKVNERGEVAGAFYNSSDPQDYHAFVYRNGAMTELFPGVRSRAHDINDSGVVTGIGIPGQVERGWVYADGTRTVIPLLTPGEQEAFAVSINNAGDVVGYGSAAPYDPFVYNAPTGRLTRLPVPFSNYAWGMDINERGEVVGVAAGGGNHPILYRDGAWTDLSGPHLGGWALSINDPGDVVGWVNPVGEFGNRAFVYRGGVMTLLGAAGLNSMATDINNLGTIVGAYGPEGARRAFVSDGTGFTDLNALLVPGTGWTLNDAEGINDRGEIVGYGRFNGADRAFLLVPVPEPAAAATLACAALLLRRSPRRRATSGAR